MSSDRLKEWGFCVGKELVVLTCLCCGSLGRKCRWTCDMERQWKLSELCSCLLSASCSMFCFLVFWNPKYPEPACSRLCQGSIPDSSGWGQEQWPCKSRALQIIPTALPAVTSHFFPSPCSVVARAKWRFLSGCFPSRALPFLLNMLPEGASLSFPILLCNAWGWSHK